MIRPLFCLSILCCTATNVCAQEEKSVDQRSVESISHPEDLSLSLWAGSEQLSNPVAFTFDNLGRMYIFETFRQNKGVEDNRGHMDWLDDDLAAQSVDDRLAYFRNSGIVQQEAEDLMHMVDAEGNRFHVVKDEIIARQNGKSAMPEDLTKKLNSFELRDLVAYLVSQKTPWVEKVQHEE